MLHLSQDSEEAIAMGGVYMTCYDTLHSVGNGAFGFVRQAQRKSDGKMVRCIYIPYIHVQGCIQDGVEGGQK